MRCTILGGSGFVGRRLARALRSGGHEVDTPARGDESIFDRDLGRLFYCTGMTADFAQRPSATVEAHAGFLSRLIERATFGHIVYLSSTRLYDSSEAEHGNADTKLRLDPRNPRHLYDLSKALGENLCLTSAGGRSCVARLSGVYDWDDGSPGFLSEWLQRAAREQAFVMDSASGAVRDYIHLDDVVEALSRLADERAVGIVNVASGENLSNSEIAGIFNRAGWTIGFTRETKREALAVCDISGLHNVGFKPRKVSEVLASWIAGAVRRGTD